jgi:hypothetical protein
MSKPYKFTKKAQVGHWETGFDPEAQYGYFEHDESGSGGGLWFENNELVDFDGMSMLPKKVSEALRSFGLVVSSDFE